MEIKRFLLTNKKAVQEGRLFYALTQKKCRKVKTEKAFKTAKC